LSDAERTIDTVRRGLAAFSRGDFEAAAHEIHPDIEWHVTFRLPDLPLPNDVYRGPEEVLQLWRAFTSAWETMETEIEEILYVDAERALLRVRFAGRGAESGVEVNRILFQAYRLREGRLIYSRGHDDEASARHDLGLTDG
jgi:ketosteroid isomerase-like protein